MPVVLLAFLSAMIAVLPAADVIPGVAAPPPATRARPHARVVVILVDGLGARKAYEPGTMPGLQARLDGKSAHGVAVASFPTITPPGLRAVFSGHRSQPEPEFPGGLQTTGEADSVLKRAAAGGLRVVAVGQFNWEPLFHGHGGLIKTVPYHGESILYGHDGHQAQSDYDGKVLAAAEPWLGGRPGSWDLMALHLFESDPIGHALGTEDEAYRRHLRWVDERITKLTARLTAQAPTTFLLVGDHGMTKAGTHGGMTPAERQVPFVLWGARVSPRSLPARPLYDAAPTITALLGVPPPAQAEGLPALEALDFTPQERAAAWLDVLEQRAARWHAVSALMPWLRGDPLSTARRAAALERAGRAEDAAQLLARAVKEVDRRLDEALPEKWMGRLLAAVWCLVLAAAFSLAWPPREPARKAAAAAGAILLACAAAPLWRPDLWAASSAGAEAAAAALMLAALSYGFGDGTGLSREAWLAWAAAMAGLCWQELLDVNLWAGVVLAAWLARRALRKPGAGLALAAGALALSALFRDHDGAFESVARAALPDLPVVHPAPAAARLVSAAVVLALLWSLRRALAAAPRRQAAVELALAGAAPAVALCLPGGGAAAGWAIAASAVCASGALVACGVETRGRCLSLAAAAFFASLATPAQACALLLSVAVGWAAGPEDDEPPLLAGLPLLALALWSFTASGGRLRYLAITVEEGHRALGDHWYPRALVALLVLKYVAGAGAALLPRLGGRSLRHALGVLPPLGALGAGFMTMLWWDRFMEGGNLRFTGQLSYVGLVSTVVIGWVILALWAAARLGRALWAPAVSADPA